MNTTILDLGFSTAACQELIYGSTHNLELISQFIVFSVIGLCVYALLLYMKFRSVYDNV